MAKAGKGKHKGKGGKYSKKTRHSGVGMRFRPKPRKELGLLLVRKKDEAQEVKSTIPKTQGESNES